MKTELVRSSLAIIPDRKTLPFQRFPFWIETAQAGWGQMVGWWAGEFFRAENLSSAERSHLWRREARRRASNTSADKLGIEVRLVDDGILGKLG